MPHVLYFSVYYLYEDNTGSVAVKILTDHNKHLTTVLFVIPPIT